MMTNDPLHHDFSNGNTSIPHHGSSFGSSVERLAKRLSVSLWKDYRQTVTDDTPSYIGTSPIKSLGRIGYLSVLQLIALWIAHTNLKYFAIFFEIYYLFGFYCCLKIWRKHGYSSVMFVFINIMIIVLEIWHWIL